jgi:outer membrane lipoprotein-sorting protein
LVVALAARTAAAQTAATPTADEVVEKSLAALGGRAALGKLKSRTMAGTISLSTPAGNVTGTLEVWNAVPNKTRTLIKVDLSALGAGPLTVDQRFNGKTGYVIDTLQGNRDMTDKQVDTLRNGTFPTPFLTYKDNGISVRLTGKEKVGERDAYVLVFEPPSGSAARQYIDAETYLPIKAVLKIDVPQLGQELEQTTELSDYRDVDGVKVPFHVTASSAVQTYTVQVTKVEHNVDIDDALFSKPTAQ